MARVSTGLKRAYLRKIYQDSVAGPVALLTALNTAATASFTTLSAGGAVISSAGNGHSVTFAEAQAWEPVTVAELCEELITLFESCERALIDSGTDSPSDGDIFSEMLDRLVAVTSFTGSFASLGSNRG